MKNNFASLNNDIDIYEKFSNFNPIIENSNQPDQNQQVYVTGEPNNIENFLEEENNIESESEFELDEDNNQQIDEDNVDEDINTEDSQQINEEIDGENIDSENIDGEEKGGGMTLNNIILILVLSLILSKIFNN